MRRRGRWIVAWAVTVVVSGLVVGLLGAALLHALPGMRTLEAITCILVVMAASVGAALVNGLMAAGLIALHAWASRGE
jgi:hypothetical protein